MKKEKLLQVRVSDMDMEMVKALAFAERRTVSSYVRWLISLAVDRRIVIADQARGN